MLIHSSVGELQIKKKIADVTIILATVALHGAVVSFSRVIQTQSFLRTN